MKLGTMGVVVLLVVLAATFALVLNGRLQGFVPISADTDARSICVETGDAFKGVGLYADAATDGRKEGEVFTQSLIWYAIEQGESQEIVGEGAYQNCGGTWIRGSPDVGEYVFTIRDGQGTHGFYLEAGQLPTGVYRSPLDISSPGGAPKPEPIGLFSFKIEGAEYCTVPVVDTCPEDKQSDLVDGSVLIVEVRIIQKPTLFSGGWTITIMHDELVLRSAIAEVSFNKDGYVLGQDRVGVVSWIAPTATYEVCRADFIERVPGAACTQEPAYYIDVVSTNPNGTVVVTRQPIPKARGSITFDLTDDLYSNELGTCDNHLQATLSTQIANIDDDFTAIAKLGAGERPVVTEVTLSSTDIREGQTITVSWKSTGTTTGYIVRVFIGGTAVLDTRVGADVHSTTFTATRTGVGSVWVTAMNRCQPSDVKETVFFVGNAYPGLCTLYPEIPQCTGTNFWAFVVALLAVIAVVVLFVILLWVAFKVVPDDYQLLAIGIAGAGALVVAIGFGLLGWFDGFAGAGTLGLAIAGVRA